MLSNSYMEVDSDEWKRHSTCHRNQPFKQHKQFKLRYAEQYHPRRMHLARGSSEGYPICRAQAVFDLEALIPLKVVHQ
jgi:hypothetical protein